MPFYLSKIVSSKPAAEFNLHGFDVVRRHNPRDLPEIVRFRYEVYEDAGYIDPSLFSTRDLSDRFEPFADQIVARTSDGELAATMRMTLPNPEGLPTEHLFNVRTAHLKREGLVDIGRFAISKKYRSRPGRLLVPILKAAIEAAVAHQAPYVVSFAPERIVETYSKLGCVSNRLQELPLTERMFQNRKPMAPYFSAGDVRPIVFSIRSIFAALELDLPSYLKTRAPEPSQPSATTPQIT